MPGSAADESRGHRGEGAALALATLRSVLGFAHGEAANLISRSDTEGTVRASIEEMSPQKQEGERARRRSVTRQIQAKVTSGDKSRRKARFNLVSAGKVVI